MASGKGRSGWRVAKVSQEHGILRAEKEASDLKVGQTVRIWPNHACVAGAGFPFYTVVDSAVEGGKRVVDVRARCNGWW